MLRIEDLYAGYGDIVVLRGISMEVKKGEVVSIIGPNGAGKSTLLKSILGLVNIKSGRILYNGIDITSYKTEKMIGLGISIAPEGSRVFPEMTVMDNLLIGAYTEEAKRHLEESLEEVFNLFPRLKERLKQKAGTLSGGERQALAIARAFVARPKLLLMDEPSLGLYPKLIANIFSSIKEINKRGVTILLAEQNIYFSLDVSDRVYIIENGTLKNGTFKPEDLRKNKDMVDFIEL